MKQKNEKPSVPEKYFLKLTGLWPAIKGSLALVRKPCIRPACRACASGKKHPTYLLAYSDKKVRRCMYVPMEMAPVLKRALEKGRRIEALLYGLGPALLQEYRAKNPTQTGPTARKSRPKSKKSPTKS